MMSSIVIMSVKMNGVYSYRSAWHFFLCIYFKLLTKLSVIRSSRQLAE